MNLVAYALIFLTVSGFFMAPTLKSERSEIVIQAVVTAMVVAVCGRTIGWW